MRDLEPRKERRRHYSGISDGRWRCGGLGVANSPDRYGGKRRRERVHGRVYG